jgi:hypothetical protein
MPRRRRLGGIAFMVVWIVFWIAAIFVAIFMLGSQAFDGELVPALVLAVWLAAALFALSHAARTLIGDIAGKAGPPRRRDGRHRWDDGIDQSPPPPPAT